MAKRQGLLFDFENVVSNAFIAEHKALFSYSTWLNAGYKPKWVKIAQQATDLCPICELTKTHIPKQKSDNANKDKNEAPSKLEEIHKHHVQRKDAQRKLFKSQIKSIVDNEMVMVLDFKEKIKLGAGPRQVNQQFYQYTQRSLLCVYIFLSNGRQLVKDFISDEIHQVTFFLSIFFFWGTESDFSDFSNNRISGGFKLH